MPYKDREQGRARWRAWRALQDDDSYKKKRADAAKKYRETNPQTEDQKRRQAEYQKGRRDEINTRTRTRYAEDEDYRTRNRAQKTAHVWSVPTEIVLLFKDQDCFYCGNPGGTIDHLVPRSKGGGNELTNLVSACKPCNSRKGTKDLSEFYELWK